MQEEARILSLVSYKFLPPQMGGQRCIAFFNRYVSRLVNLRCVTVKDNGPATAEGYPVKNLLSKHPVRYANLAYFFILRRIIRSEKITHLIIEHPYYGWLGILLKWFCKIKLIVHSHNIESLRFKSIGKWWWGILWHYEKITHRHATENLFITDNDREFAIKNFLLNPAKCHTITYGFELTKPALETERQQARKTLRALHHIDEDEIVLLFNGTLDYKPNLDAVDVILQHINPILQLNQKLKYKIVCKSFRITGIFKSSKTLKICKLHSHFPSYYGNKSSFIVLKLKNVFGLNNRSFSNNRKYFKSPHDTISTFYHNFLKGTIHAILNFFIQRSLQTSSF